MSTVELKKRLIDIIQKTKDERILEEVYRIFELEKNDIGVFKLDEEQKNAISEARIQVKEGQFLTEEQANKEIDEWLNQ